MGTSTIIVLTVLSTLSVVAIVATVVVAFMKLGRKINTLEANSIQEISVLSNNLYTEYRQADEEIILELTRFKKEVDSRLDKINNKVMEKSLVKS